ncbi:hypothetical protein EJ04DRAFT_596593 [Polyplosphaeria fusca]|uniref:Uncharacterized protein n=1 Tax=Polyplosphaeria fusca TaxID=682080 RepID=A0A9P4USQ4_9PLEO|nr:hypothetical protein EJ04DRAFT_596593 [Polyplosphaeria fusca]
MAYDHISFKLRSKLREILKVNLAEKTVADRVPPALDAKMAFIKTAVTTSEKSKEKQELTDAEAVSISGTTFALTDADFHDAKTLHINTKGIGVLRLPLPSSELEVSVHNTDGSLAYLSTRERRRSGNCILTNADGKQLTSTTYFFGPNRNPVLNMLDNAREAQEIRTASRWTSRTQEFVLPEGHTLEWSYKKALGFGKEGKKGTALVLTLGEKRLAALIRNEDTRTPGSKSCSAGNGGQLVISQEVVERDYDIPEAIVVATCLLMLKKEIDRRRAVQFMMIASASGSV